MNRKVILLVEDNANDEYLTLRALKKYNVANDVIVARDGGLGRTRVDRARLPWDST